MDRKFIIDEEIRLKDGTDLLNTKVYANALKNIITNIPNDKPFTIGLYGMWGSGKSSIIKTVQEELAETNKSYLFATFDAWKYTGDAFRRSFILSIASQLRTEKNIDDIERKIYTNTIENISTPKYKFPLKWWHLMIICTTAIILSILVLVFFPYMENIRNYIISFITISAVIPMLTIAYKVIETDTFERISKFLYSKFYNQYELETPLLFSPEQFEKTFKEIVSNVNKEGERLVVVIDNIDRCEQQYACELLSTIKGFLECAKSVIFILPVDNNALKKHINNVYDNEMKDAEEFLRKFFNVTITIKPYQSEQIKKFAHELNRKYSLNFNITTLDIISEEYAKNPRRIIQILNNLSIEIETFQDKSFATEYETAICKLLILREEFPEFYNLLTQNTLILNIGTEESEKYEKENKELKRFLDRTKLYSEKLGDKSIYKIISNSDVFQNISNLVMSSTIWDLDYDKLMEIIDNKTEKRNLVIEYFLDEIGRFKEGNVDSYRYRIAHNCLALLAKLNNSIPFDRNINIRIEAHFKPTITKILEGRSIDIELVTYSSSLYDEGREYLSKAIFDYLKSEINRLNGTYSNDKSRKQTSDIVPIFNKYVELFKSKLDLNQLSDISKKLSNTGLEIMDI